jgi:hypothetical protein
MLIRDQEFPISDGPIVAAIRAAFVAKGWGTGLSSGTVLPATKTRRMFTVRDDGGTAVGRTQARRQGVNLWSDDPVEVKLMGLEALRVAQFVLPTGSVIAATSGFFGPVPIDDDVPYVVATKPLHHVFVSFVADVKASKPS